VRHAHCLSVGAMRNLASVVVVAVGLSQGCYLGPSPTQRHVAMVMNGVLAVGGIALTAVPDSAPQDCNCLLPNLGADLAHAIGPVPLVAGLIGLVINVAAAPAEAAPTPIPPPRPAEVEIVELSTPMYCTADPEHGRCYVDEATCNLMRASDASICTQHDAAACFTALRVLDNTRFTSCSVTLAECEARRGREVQNPDLASLSAGCSIYKGRFTKP